jgi:hypothetical protein
VEQDSFDDPAIHETMLAIARKRRCFFFGMVIGYLPIFLTTLQFTDSYTWIGTAFLVWLILLCISVVQMACCKCPRCGNTFYMRCSTLSFLARCCHCGLSTKEMKDA